MSGSKPPRQVFSRPPLFPTDRDELDVPQHEGQRKTAMAILQDLNDRGLGEVLQRVAMSFHVTPLEVCSSQRTRPIPSARAEVWAYLLTAPPSGPGWSAGRVGEAWGLDPTTITTAVKLRQRRTRRQVPDLDSPKGGK